MIRKATLSDLDDLIKLLVLFKRDLTNYVPDDLKVFRKKEKPISLIRESVKEELENKKGLFLVIEEKKELIGFGYGTINEYVHMLFEPVRHGMLNHIWIKENFRGKGFSSMLKDRLFDWFVDNDCKYVKLLVLDINPAKEIYENWGFELYLDSMIKVID